MIVKLLTEHHLAFLSLKGEEGEKTISSLGGGDIEVEKYIAINFYMDSSLTIPNTKIKG